MHYILSNICIAPVRGHYSEALSTLAYIMLNVITIASKIND